MKMGGSGFWVLGSELAAVPQNCQCVFNAKTQKGCAVCSTTEDTDYSENAAQEKINHESHEGAPPFADTESQT